MSKNSKSRGSRLYGVLIMLLCAVLAVMSYMVYVKAKEIYLAQPGASSSTTSTQIEVPVQGGAGSTEQDLIPAPTEESVLPTPDEIQPGLVENVEGGQVQVNAPKSYSLPLPIDDKIGNAGLLPGTGIIIVKEMDDTQVKSDQCTVAFSVAGVDGFPWAITAGHCGEVGEKVYSLPVDGNFFAAQFLGTVRAVSRSSYETGAGDWAAIRLDPQAVRPQAPGGIPMNLVVMNIERGDRLCKNGSRTGYDCGPQGGKNLKTIFEDLNAKLDEVILCALSGDSGSPIYSNKGIVGVLSSSTASKEDMQNGFCSQESGAYYTPTADVVEQVKAQVPNAVFVDN